MPDHAFAGCEVSHQYEPRGWGVTGLGPHRQPARAGGVDRAPAAQPTPGEHSAIARAFRNKIYQCAQNCLKKVEGVHVDPNGSLETNS
jgi:hypothetical protein